MTQSLLFASFSATTAWPTFMTQDTNMESKTEATRSTLMTQEDNTALTQGGDIAEVCKKSKYYYLPQPKIDKRRSGLGAISEEEELAASLGEYPEPLGPRCRSWGCFFKREPRCRFRWYSCCCKLCNRTKGKEHSRECLRRNIPNSQLAAYDRRMERRTKLPNVGHGRKSR